MNDVIKVPTAIAPSASDYRLESTVYVANSPAFTKSQLHKKKKSELVDMVYDYRDEWRGDNYTKNELVKDLLKTTKRKYYEVYAQQKPWRERDDYDFIIRGIGQRDNVQVKQVGDESNFYSSAYLENLFFNTPIYAVCEVYKGDELLEEIDLVEFMPCIYEYDKATIIADAMKVYAQTNFGNQLKAHLEAKLPDEPNSANY